MSSCSICVIILYLKCTKKQTKTVIEDCVTFCQHLAIPATFLVTCSKAKAMTSHCKLTWQPLVSSPHLPEHPSPVTSTTKQSVSFLAAPGDAKVFQRKTNTIKIFSLC